MASISSFVIFSRYCFWIKITRILSVYCPSGTCQSSGDCLVIFLMSFFSWFFFFFGLACIYLFKILSIYASKMCSTMKNFTLSFPIPFFSISYKFASRIIGNTYLAFLTNALYAYFNFFRYLLRRVHCSFCLLWLSFPIMLNISSINYLP